MADFSSPNEYHLIHANVALARAPLDDPIMAGFVQQVDQIDELAQAAPGFVAQPMPKEAGLIYTGRSLLNLSIWESVDSLEHFT